MSERIRKLLDGVQVMHRCEAVHVESVPVVEMFGGKTVWAGVVEVFRLVGHPRAQRAYAWTYKENGEDQFVTVLELPPVDSPQTAVRASIMASRKPDRV